MLLKRRFWNEEQKMKCDFSKPFSRAWVEYSIWATNNWESIRKSGAHLLFLLPKSSFGEHAFLANVFSHMELYSSQTKIWEGWKKMKSGFFEVLSWHARSFNTAGIHALLTRWTHHDSITVWVRLTLRDAIHLLWVGQTPAIFTLWLWWWVRHAHHHWSRVGNLACTLL